MKRDSASAVRWAAALLCAFVYPAQAGNGTTSNAISGEWPQRLGARRLYRCEHGLVYAGDKSAAGQVQKMLGTAIKDAQKDGVADPTAGLVIVMDAKEKLPFDIVKLLEATSKMETPEAGGESEKVLKSFVETREKLEKEGLSMNTLLSIVPLPIAPAVLSQVAQEFPEDADRQVAWCVVLPTSKCIKAGFKSIIDVAMKKEKPGLAQRVALAAMMPLIERKVVSQMKKAQQATLYQFLVEAHSGLSAEEKTQKIDAYKKRLGLDGEFKITDSDREEPPAKEEDE